MSKKKNSKRTKTSYLDPKKRMKSRLDRAGDTSSKKRKKKKGD